MKYLGWIATPFYIDIYGSQMMNSNDSDIWFYSGTIIKLAFLV